MQTLKALAKHDLFPQLHRITPPALVIAGQQNQSPVFTPEYYAAIAAAMPHGTYLVRFQVHMPLLSLGMSFSSVAALAANIRCESKAGSMP